MSFGSRGYTPPRSSSSQGVAPSVSRGPSVSALTAGKSIAYGGATPSSVHHRSSSQVAASFQSHDLSRQYSRSQSVVGSTDAYPSYSSSDPAQRTPPRTAAEGLGPRHPAPSYSLSESTALLPVVRNPRAEETKAAYGSPQRGHSLTDSPSRPSLPTAEFKQESALATRGGLMMELDHTIGLASARAGALVLHPDGKHSVSIVGSSVVIGSLTDPADQRVLRGHDEAVTCIAVSPSGRWVASGQTGENADVVVWDLRTGAQKYRMSEHFHGIAAVAFSDDELFLATVGDALDKKMYIWDLSTGNIVSSTPVPPLRSVRWGGRVRDVKGRPTHLYLLAAATPSEPTVLTWALDPSSGELQLDKCKTGTVQRQYSALEFSRVEELLFAGSESGDVVVFHSRSHMLQHVFPACALGVGAIVAVPIAGTAEPQELIVIGGGDGTVTAYRCCRPSGPASARAATSWVAEHTCRLTGAVTSLSLGKTADPAAPNSLVAATALGQVFSITITEAREWRALLSSEHPVSPLTAVAFAPGSSDRFVTATVDGAIRVWSAVDYSVAVRIQCPCAVRSLAATEDFIAAGCADGVIRSFDPRSGQAMWAIPDAHREGVECIAVSSNRRFIVSGGVRGEVRAWDVRTRELLCNLKEHQLAVTSVALMADGKHAVSCSRDRSVLCWDLQQERRVSAHKQNMGAILGLALCPHPVGNPAQALSTAVLTVGQEKSVTLWDLRQPRALRVQAASSDPNAEATCVAVANRQPMYATAGTDQTVRLWDAASGRLLAAVRAHSSSVACLQFSGDDRQIVSVGSDGAICIINVFAL